MLDRENTEGLSLASSKASTMPRFQLQETLWNSAVIFPSPVVGSIQHSPLLEVSYSLEYTLN